MSKVLIIGDLHIGSRNSSSIFLNYMKNYFNTELFPLIKSENIKTVIQLGDTLDKRKQIDFVTSAFLIKEWFSWFDKNNVKLYSIIGNHDTYYKNTNELSGVKQYEELFKNVNIITKPYSLLIDNVEYRLIPWICSENKEECIEYIKKEVNTEYTICCGHFELSGFDIQKNFKCKTSLVDSNIFSNMTKVFSGHFHTPSISKNIEYIGTPYMLTWSDYGDKKKVIIHDTITNECNNIYTKSELFKKICITSETDVNDIVLDNNSYVKIIVSEKNNDLDVIANTLTNKYNLSQCQIIDATDSVDIITDELNNIELEDPFNIMIKSIQSLNNPWIESELLSIYKEAQSKEKE